jgi:putative exporter of polyketide antibiotics
VGTLSISILLLIILLIIRFVFDLYGYSVGYFEHSLYSPFELITRNLTKINNSQQKQIIEEITDFIMELIINIIGILLTMFIIIRMLRKKRNRRHRELEALAMDVLRRMTV